MLRYTLIRVSLASVRATRPMLIPMQRRLRDYLMETSWGGAARPIADYASDGGARFYISPVGFMQLCRLIPGGPSMEGAGVYAPGKYYTHVLLRSRAVAACVFVDTLDTGGVAEPPPPPSLSVLSQCTCALCQTEVVRVGWDSVTRTLCEKHDCATAGCNDCASVSKRVVVFDDMYMCRCMWGAGEVFLRGGGVDYFELMRGGSGSTCTWRKLNKKI